MQKIRHVIQLIFTTPLSDSLIAKTADVARNTVRRYRILILEKDYRWEDLVGLSDGALDAKFNSALRRLTRKRMPDFAVVHAELQQKGVTLTLLWEEYRAPSPEDALSYSQFTEHYRTYVCRIDRVMRQTHTPGEKCFVDFSGLRPQWRDRNTGKDVFVELFVAVLGYSNLTFATCVASQAIPDWIEAHNRMFAFFGGVSKFLVPDNLKAAVDRPGVDPALNRTYQEMGEHYASTIVPARSYRPQDKASVEVGVQIVQRWILARLRKMTFFSLAEINQAIAELLPSFNDRAFKRLPGCRRSRFDEAERSQLQPLPANPYVLAEWTGQLRVDNGYHLQIAGHWYSVPHRLVGQRVSARLSAGVVEIFHQHLRVASHLLSTVPGGLTTDPTHQPEGHRAYAERTPDKVIAWATTVGPHLLAVVQQQFERTVPALGLPACDGLRKLVRVHGPQEVEAAARRAVEIQSLTLKSVKSLLHSGRHRRSRQPEAASALPTDHPNVRGSAYYSQTPEA
jgi:transposase